MQIKFKKGFRVKGDPVRVYSALEGIRIKHGGIITPENVLEAARRQNNPLHNEFVWDDTKAAHEYRMSQARYIVRSIEIVRTKGVLKEHRVYEITSFKTEPAKLNTGITGDVETGGRHEYKTLEDILNDPEDRAAMVDRARRDLHSWLNKYGMLSELQLVIDTVRSAVK